MTKFQRVALAVGGVILALVLFGSYVFPPAKAETGVVRIPHLCSTPAVELLDMLGNVGEEIVWRHELPNGRVVVMTQNAEIDTWSLILVLPDDDVACFLDSEAGPSGME